MHVLFHPGRGCVSDRFRRRFPVRLRFPLISRLGLALHLQPVFLQLLRVERLLRILVRCLLRMRVLRPALAAISASASAPATSATAAPAMFFSAFLRWAIAVLRTLLRPLLLRRALRPLIRPALALRAFVRLPLGLRKLALLGDFSLRAVRTGLLLLLRGRWSRRCCWSPR